MLVTQKASSINVENIAGAGLAKKVAMEEHYYGVLGAVSSILQDDIINSLSANASLITETVSNLWVTKNINNYDPTKDYSKVIAYLCGEITKVGLCALRNLAIKYDRLKPIEGIIQLMQYCKGENTSFIMDVTTAELLASLPISNDRAKRIYLDKKISSVDELNNIQYSNDEKRMIGEYLYYMLRAAGKHVDVNTNFNECMQFLNMEKNWKEFDDMYYDVATLKKQQVFYAKMLIERFGSVPQIHVNSSYVTNVLRKLSKYMPTEAGEVYIDFSGRALQSMIDKDAEAGINAFGEAVAFTIASRENRKDDIKEECRKQMIEGEGMEGNTADEIIKESEDIMGASDKKNDDNIVLGGE